MQAELAIEDRRSRPLLGFGNHRPGRERCGAPLGWPESIPRSGGWAPRNRTAAIPSRTRTGDLYRPALPRRRIQKIAPRFDAKWMPSSGVASLCSSLWSHPVPARDCTSPAPFVWPSWSHGPPGPRPSLQSRRMADSGSAIAQVLIPLPVPVSFPTLPSWLAMNGKHSAANNLPLRHKCDDAHSRIPGLLDPRPVSASYARPLPPDACHR